MSTIEVKDTECIICLDNDNSLHKMKCCNSYYHKPCLRQALASMHYFQCPHCKKVLDRKQEQPVFCNSIMYNCIIIFLMMMDFSLSFSGSTSIIHFTKRYPNNYDHEPEHYYPITLLTIIVALVNVGMLIMYSKYYFYIWKYKPLYDEEQIKFNYLCNHYLLHVARLITYLPILIFSSIVDDKSVNIYYSVITFCIIIPYILLLLFVSFFYNMRDNPGIMINPRFRFYKLLSIKFEHFDQSTIDVDRYIV